MKIQTLQTGIVKPDEGSQPQHPTPSSKQPQDKSSKSGLQRLSALSLDHLDRKDSYFQVKPTQSEKKEWLLQSIVPLLGLLLTLFITMIVYEIPTTTFAMVETPPTTTKKDFANPESTFEGCLRFNDFHRYLDRPEEDESFYCVADMIPKKNQSIRNLTL